MLERLVQWSVERRGMVLALWAVVATVAALQLKRLSIDAVPDVTNTQVVVLASAPGLSPVEIEQYLTYPIETALNGIPGVTEIRSISRTAVSSITVIFEEGTNVWFARQLVAERLKIAEADIPPSFGKPEMAPVSTGLGEIYEFYLASKHHSPMELRTLLDWVVAYKLRSVPGVIEVNSMGGAAKQYQVILDPKKLAARRLTLRHVHDMLVASHGSAGGGYIEKNREAFVIRGDAQLKTVSDIGNTVVAADQDGTPVLLRDVAKVQIGTALRFGAVTKLGEGEIAAGTVMMLIGANSRDVVGRVKARLGELQRELPPGVEIRSYYDRSEFIGRMLKTVAMNLAEGALLVVTILFLTLGTFRGALIAAMAIPLAMAIAILGMVRLGVTGNLMSLGAIDFGLLVDGAIVLLEATLTQLALRRVESRAEVAHTVARAMRTAATPVAFSLLIILMVYLPLMTLEGVEGKMFRPMAITVALALAGALLFSLTAFPALAAFVMKSPKHAHAPDKGVFGWLRRCYRATLDLIIHRPKAVFLPVLGCLLITGLLGSRLGAEFVPRLDEGELSLDVRRLPSISITEAQRLGVEVEQVLSRIPEVLSVVTRTGRAEVATDPVGPDESAVRVRLIPREQWTTATDLDGLGDHIKQAIEREVPATFVAVSQPIEDRVNQLLAGSRADLVIKVFGQDLSRLKATADRIGHAVGGISGAADLRVQRVLGLGILQIVPDRLRLARYGIPASHVLEVVEASRVGWHVGRIVEGARRFELTLLQPPAQATPEAFGELLIGTPSGQLLPLAALATISETEGPSVINREALERRVLVEVNVRGRDLVSFVNEARRRVAQVPLPKGVHLSWGGQFENFSRASARLGLVVPIALATICAMLFLMFRSVRYMLAVFSGAPLALVGGIAGLSLRGLSFSIPAGVGFIAVAGVAVLNGVVLASEVKQRLHLCTADDLDGRQRAISEGSVAVLRSILTTAMVAAIGFLPMAISTRAGAEVQRPLATVVIGGILSSTVLSLLVLPTLLRLFVASTPRD